MTLQAGLAHGGKAYLWCDTAFFDGETGQLVAIDSKSFHGLHWPFAGTTSSIGGNPHEIAFAIGNAWPKDLDSLLAATSDALRRYAAKGYFARVLLATWTDRPRLWLTGTDDCAGEGAFVPCEVLHYANGSNGLPEYERAERLGMNPKRMRRVIDAQLAAPVPAAGPLGEAGRLVQYGGSIVELEVSRGGVDSRVSRAIHETAEAA